MEVFQGARFVRLRCNARSTGYLAAGEDGISINHNGRRTAPNSVWGIEAVPEDYGEPAVLLRGAYGRYLSTAIPATPGFAGALVAVQESLIDEFASSASRMFLWEPLLRDGHIVLRNLSSGGFLRTCGWDQVISVGRDNGTHDADWVLEIVPPTLHRPNSIEKIMKNPTQFSQRKNAKMSSLIHYIRADEHGVIDEEAWQTLHVHSNSLAAVFAKLHELDRDARYTTLCVRGGRYGQLTPLLLDLPCTSEWIDIVMVPHQSPVENELMYPDVDAAQILPVDKAHSVLEQQEDNGLRKLPTDILHRIILRLPTLRDILRMACTSKWLYNNLKEREFLEAYYTNRGRSVRHLIGMVNCQPVRTVATALLDPVPISFNAILESAIFCAIDSRTGWVLLHNETTREMVVYNPVTSTVIFLPILESPSYYNMLAAGIVRAVSGGCTVIVLFGQPTKSIFAKERVLIAICDTGSQQNWKTFPRYTNFPLPRSKLQVYSPSIVAGSEWFVLAFNNCVISVNMEKEYQVSRLELPFETSLSVIPAHKIGKCRFGHLLLLRCSNGILTVWQYSDGSWNLFREHSVDGMDLASFAEENCLVFTDHLVAFNPDTGEVSMPLHIPDMEHGKLLALEIDWLPQLVSRDV